MGISVYWDTETEQHIVLHIDFHGAWRWDDYDEAVDEADALMRSVGERVDVICNFLDSQRVPLDYVCSHLRRMMQILGENAGAIVLVNSNEVFNAVVYVFCKGVTSFPCPIRIAETIQDAYAFLTERQLQ